MVDVEDGHPDDELIGDVVGSSNQTLSSNFTKPADRFHDATMRILEQRARKKWRFEKSGSDIAVFVFVDHPTRPFASGVETCTELSSVMQLQIRSCAVFGNIFFLDINAATGSSIPIPTDKDDDVLDWLMDNGFGAFPAVIADRKSSMASLFPRVESFQEEDEVTVQKIRSKKNKVTHKSLRTALAEFHQDRLLSPAGKSGAWEKDRSHEYVPARGAERKIQEKLAIFLSGWFRTKVKVEEEVPVSVGRIDIQLSIKGKPGKGLTCWAIIELKLTRSFRNPRAGMKTKAAQLTKVTDGINASEVAKGFRQADAFARAKNLRKAYYEIFDMCKIKDPAKYQHNTVINQKAKCKVEIEDVVRPMYGTSDEARMNS